MLYYEAVNVAISWLRLAYSFGSTISAYDTLSDMLLEYFGVLLRTYYRTITKYWKVHCSLAHLPCYTYCQRADGLLMTRELVPLLLGCVVLLVYASGSGTGSGSVTGCGCGCGCGWRTSVSGSRMMLYFFFLRLFGVLVWRGVLLPSLFSASLV